MKIFLTKYLVITGITLLVALGFLFLMFTFDTLSISTVIPLIFALLVLLVIKEIAFLSFNQSYEKLNLFYETLTNGNNDNLLELEKKVRIQETLLKQTIGEEEYLSLLQKIKVKSPSKEELKETVDTARAVFIEEEARKKAETEEEEMKKTIIEKAHSEAEESKVDNTSKRNNRGNNKR